MTYIPPSGGGGSGDYILLQDQKTVGTNGGTATAGSWQTRTLNTIVADTTGAVTLGSNQFVLPAGTYRINVRAPACSVSVHQCRLRNITDSITVALGSPEYSFSSNDAAAAVSNHSCLTARFTIAGSKTFEIQHQAGATKASYGYGVAAGFDTEIYTSVELIKE